MTVSKLFTKQASVTRTTSLHNSYLLMVNDHNWHDGCSSSPSPNITPSFNNSHLTVMVSAVDSFSVHWFLAFSLTQRYNLHTYHAYCLGQLASLIYTPCQLTLSEKNISVFGTIRKRQLLYTCYSRKTTQWKFLQHCIFDHFSFTQWDLSA